MAAISSPGKFALAHALHSNEDANTIATAVAGGGSFTQAAVVAALTDSSGGATADGTIAAVTAPTATTDSSGGTAGTTMAAQVLPTALTDNGGGTADGTVQAQATFAGSVAWNGSSVFPSAADEAALTAIALAARNNFKEFTARQTENLAQFTVIKDSITTLGARQVQNRAAIVALTDAVKELSTKIAAILTSIKNAGIMSTS